jgi:hypothetical protein
MPLLQEVIRIALRYVGAALVAWGVADDESAARLTSPEVIGAACAAAAEAWRWLLTKTAN